MINIDKKYATKSGLPVTIYTTSAKHHLFPVHGSIDLHPADEVVGQWTKDGEHSTVKELDLVEQEQTTWVVVISTANANASSGSIDYWISRGYPSREAALADYPLCKTILACVQIKFNVGQGLEKESV